MDFFSVGIDIGGTNINWGIVERSSGAVMENNLWATRDFENTEYLSRKIHDILSEKKLLERIEGIGIGAPAANSVSGIINQSSNLPWTGIVPVVEDFKKHFNVDIRLENDARAAAWGEKVFGGAREVENYALITLGTGLGCGIVLDNKLLIGDNLFAGEIGHIIIERNGRRCGCGRNGCLETYVSASGIVRSYQELSGDDRPVSSLDIYHLCTLGDEWALRAFDLTAEYLSYGIAQLLTITGIKNIFIFGGPAESGDYLFHPLRTYVRENTLHLINSDINISKSMIRHQFAAVLGAAALIY